MAIAKKEEPDEGPAFDVDKLVEALKGHVAFKDLFASPEPAPAPSRSSETSSGGSGRSISDEIELALRRREEQRALLRGTAAPSKEEKDEPAPLSWRERLWKGVDDR